MTSYAKLPLEPQRKEPKVEALPEPPEGDAKPGLHSYLDEFLSAIKVFGYLERPVFHELTRHMQTRKLLAGETINLENEKSLCIVVDGHVQVFFKTEVSEKETTADDFDDGHEGYRLLTDVRNGAPLSSMFSILSLFTEEVRLRHGPPVNNGIHVQSQENPPPSMPTSPMPLPVGSTPDSPRTNFANNKLREASRAGSSQNLSELPHIPLLNPPEKPQARNNVHPGVIARANIDTTLAVIPAEAFRRLTRIYPKASAHIVQVIMTRFQRVTFATGHNYLGLTAEILRTERQMNDFTTYDLPNYVQASSLDRLKQKLKSAEKLVKDSERDTGIVVSSPQARRPTSIRLPSLKKRSQGRSRVNFSDLMASVDESKGQESEADGIATPSSAREPDESEEDNSFRDSVLHCMFKSLGLEQTSEQSNSGDVSVEQSPKMTPLDFQDVERQSRTSFGHAISNMAHLKLEANASDALSESVFTSNSMEGIETEMDNDLEIIHFPRNAVLVEAQERSPGLYYVIDGFLEVGLMVPRTSNATVGRPTKKDPNMASSTNPFEQSFEEADDGFRSLFTVKPGGIAGYQAGIGNYRSFIDVRAKTDVLVGFLPRDSLERIMEKKPVVLLTMAKRLISLLSPLILHLDFALEWLQVSAGQPVYRQGDDADAIYIILNGRLRSVKEKATGLGEAEVLGEYGGGESVGELEVLTDIKRPSTLHAVRDTELARFPKQLFQSLAQEHPGITMQISKLIAKRMGDLLKNGDQAQRTNGGVASVENIRTICILPIHQGVPVVDFAESLSQSLQHLGSKVALLHQAEILAHLGRYAFSRIGKLRLAGHLADLEEKYSKLLYVADGQQVNSPWITTCIGQADYILLVALADESPEIGEYERQLIGMKTTARKELVLLHSSKYVYPGSTRQWLKPRPWVHSHFHIQMDSLAADAPVRPRTAQRTITTIKNKLQNVSTEISRFRNKLPRPGSFGKGLHKNDHARLARKLCGKSIGLILGGGGARGISHVGVIKAMEELGIPIDTVGGTSIGSFIGGLYAKDGDLLPMYGRAKQFSARMAGLWRFLFDLTYPGTAYTTGHVFNRGIWKAFGDAQIEDFWLPYFANTTNISHSRMDIHTTGYAWRYVRASMSLAGLVPPMTEAGEMLCDGGYVDNLPVSTMQRMGVRTIFAVDVGSVDDHIEMTYGDTLSGFWALWNRWNPISSHPNVPTLAELQARLAYSASVPALEKAKRAKGCIYMRPPISGYGTLEFGKFDEVYSVGYDFAKKFLAQLHIDGKLENIVEDGRRKIMRRNSRPMSKHRRRNSL
jgi:predicted acylesterase/phospholipase RssA/CRP-like cAMP-binding protein